MKRYDVFLSYNSADRVAVETIAQRLQEAGVEPFFDEWALKPGDDVQACLEEALEASTACAVFRGGDGFGSWQRNELRIALERRQGDDGFRVFAVFLPAAPPGNDGLPGFLRIYKWVRFASGLNDHDAFSMLLDGIRAAATVSASASTPKPSAPPPANPFDPNNPAVPPAFVGRKRELRELRAAVDRGAGVSVVGDRRIGKSSLLLTWQQMLAAEGRVVRYVTGEGAEGASVAAFVQAVTGEPSPAGTEAAADQLAAWARREGLPGLPPVLLVDEVERIIAQAEHRFLERLRGMMDELVLVLASARDLDAVYSELGRTSPFYNRLSLLRLGLLSEAATDDLLSRGDGLLEPSDRELLRRWAGRHPFYLQSLGLRLVAARGAGEGVEKALDDFCDEAGSLHLPLLIRSLTPLEQGALRRAAGRVSQPSRPLRRRGLLGSDGLPFGEVLAAWLREEV